MTFRAWWLTLPRWVRWALIIAGLLLLIGILPWWEQPPALY